MGRKSSKSIKNWPNRSQFWFRMKTMPIELQWSNFDFEKKIKIVRQFSLNGVQIIKICPKIKGWWCFRVLNVVNSKLYTKNSAISLFFGLFQQFSWELISIQNQNLTNAALSAPIQSTKPKIGSWLISFYWVLTICTKFWQELSHKSDPFYKIRIWQMVKWQWF
jgi:hypothetical protein